MADFVDANIWMYLTFADSPFHLNVKRFLKPYLDGVKTFSVSWQVFYEFIRGVTDPSIFARPLKWTEAHSFMEKIFRAPQARILGEGEDHIDVLKEILKESGYTRGHFIHDCHIAVLLRENGIRRIITADEGFRRFSTLDVINPTA